MLWNVLVTIVGTIGVGVGVVVSVSFGVVVVSRVVSWVFLLVVPRDFKWGREVGEFALRHEAGSVFSERFHWPRDHFHLQSCEVTCSSNQSCTPRVGTAVTEYRSSTCCQTPL